MAEKRRVLLLSTLKIHGYDYLEYAATIIREFLNKSKVKRIIFIPYALVNYDDYTAKVRDGFKKNDLDFDIIGIHEKDNPIKAVEEADAVFIGGGNTFLLLKTLYKTNLVEVIRERVMKDGMPFIGSSAGTNVATINICTTNDMPIVHVPTLSAINLVPFNINPHYLDADPNSTHMGETRAQRIQQYQEMEESYPVLGLREGSVLSVEGNKAILVGKSSALLFLRGKEPVAYEPGSDLSFLLR